MATDMAPRRALLLGLGGSALMAACGRKAGDGAATRSVIRVAYGTDARQYGVLAVPKDTQPRGTVVMLHGGGWLPNASLRTLEPMQAALTALGYITWNLEYRGVGVGGGFPGTLEDVASGIDSLLRVRERVSGIPDQMLTRQVAFLGHSAGAQLAVWAASRTGKTPGGEPRIRPRAVISMAGPLNLTLGAREHLAGDIIPNFMHGLPAEVPDRYAVADPVRLVPASAPVWVLSGTNDTVVPKEQGLSYVAAARKSGGQAYFLPTHASHTQFAAPGGQSWGYVREILARRFREG